MKMTYQLPAKNILIPNWEDYIRSLCVQPRLKTTKSLANLQSLDAEVAETVTWPISLANWNNNFYVDQTFFFEQIVPLRFVWLLTQVNKVRLLKAQARAVITELRKSWLWKLPSDLRFWAVDPCDVSSFQLFSTPVNLEKCIRLQMQNKIGPPWSWEWNRLLNTHRVGLFVKNPALRTLYDHRNFVLFGAIVADQVCWFSHFTFWHLEIDGEIQLAMQWGGTSL